MKPWWNNGVRNSPKTNDNLAPIFMLFLINTLLAKYFRTKIYPWLRNFCQKIHPWLRNLGRLRNKDDYFIITTISGATSDNAVTLTTFFGYHKSSRRGTVATGFSVFHSHDVFITFDIVSSQKRRRTKHNISVRDRLYSSCILGRRAWCYISVFLFSTSIIEKRKYVWPIPFQFFYVN